MYLYVVNFMKKPLGRCEDHRAFLTTLHKGLDER